MSSQQISIETGLGRRTIDADVEGVFAVHERVPVGVEDGWTVTHVPTGWKCVDTLTRLAAVGARAEFLASGLDWTFDSPKRLTMKHKLAGRAIKRKYEGQ